MSMITKRFTLGFLVLGAMALCSCVAYIRPAPPPPRYVEVGPPPYPGFVWMAGYWGWNGGGYVWVPGRWIAPPFRGAVWIPAHWVRRPRGWVLVRGHWR
jgi:hypothetical protein